MLCAPRYSHVMSKLSGTSLLVANFLKEGTAMRDNGFKGEMLKGRVTCKSNHMKGKLHTLHAQVFDHWEVSHKYPLIHRSIERSVIY